MAKEMSLKYKLQRAVDEAKETDYKYLAGSVDFITEDFYIGFANWIFKQPIKILLKGVYYNVLLEKRMTTKELLEQYKSEK